MKRDPNKIITTLKNGRIRVQTHNEEPSMTQQQFADDTDVNNIIAKYKKTGEFTHLSQLKGVYGDFSEVKTYQEMVQQVVTANEQFMTLPSDVRYKFRNDPQELINFLNSPNNREEAIKLGLIPKPTAIPDTQPQTNPKQTTNPSDKTN